MKQLLDEKRIEFLKQDYPKGFPGYCGIEVLKVDQGVFHSMLKVQLEHEQQDGFVHAGVIATMADHTAGYSLYTVVSENVRVLTIEFKINYFKPARGEKIICKSKVVNMGKNISVAESEIFTIEQSKETLISKAIVTLAMVPETKIISS